MNFWNSVRSSIPTTKSEHENNRQPETPRSSWQIFDELKSTIRDLGIHATPLSEAILVQILHLLRERWAHEISDRSGRLASTYHAIDAILTRHVGPVPVPSEKPTSSHTRDSLADTLRKGAAI